MKSNILYDTVREEKNWVFLFHLPLYSFDYIYIHIYTCLIIYHFLFAFKIFNWRIVDFCCGRIMEDFERHLDLSTCTCRQISANSVSIVACGKLSLQTYIDMANGLPSLCGSFVAFSRVIKIFTILILHSSFLKAFRYVNYQENFIYCYIFPNIVHVNSSTILRLIHTNLPVWYRTNNTLQFRNKIHISQFYLIRLNFFILLQNTI